MSIFRGSGVAIITPFTDTGVNYIKLEELIEWHIAEGTDAIIICGTTGEATTMSESEKREVIKFTIEKVNKRIPVIAGTGSNNTKAAIESSQYAESLGVDSLLLITPYYNKTNKEGLFKHFEAINNSVHTPIILYNVPGRTNVNITPKDLERLATLSNVQAIKEASGNLSQIAEMKALCGDKIDIYSGNDDQTIPILSLGGIGVISVLANVVPKEVHEMVDSYLNNNTATALNIFIKYFDLTKKLFIETNPIPVKTALNLMGKAVGPLRLPLYEMDKNNEEILTKALKANNLL